MKVTELKAACKGRGLTVSGRKAELVARLQKYVVEKTANAQRTSSVATVAPALPAATASSVKDEVYAMFDVEDDAAKDAAMVDAVSNFEQLSQSSHASATKNNVDGAPGPGPGSDSNSKPAAINSAAAISAAMRRAAAQPSFSQVSLSPATSQSSSQTSVNYSMTNTTLGTKPASASGLTEEQRARMRRNSDEAKKRKLARLSASGTTAAAVGSATKTASVMNYSSGKMTGSFQNTSRKISLSPSTASVAVVSSQSNVGHKGQMGNGGKNNDNLSQRSPVNPYLRKSKIIKRDERPREEERTLEELPPLPEDAPPIREETRARLSDQQLEVIMTARPPTVTLKADTDGTAVDEQGNGGNSATYINQDLFPQKHQPPKTHPMVRVNAAAGTGKTTTLLHLATRCIDLGHTSLTYVTFTRASAKDAQDRMQSVLDERGKKCVSGSTLHSCAMRLLQNDPSLSDEQIKQQEKRLLDDHAFQNLIKEQWGRNIETYLEHAIDHVRSSKKEEAMHKMDGKERVLFDKALFYLTKTFDTFMRSDMSLDGLRDENNKSRHWYPFWSSQPVFMEGGTAAKLGFPPEHYNTLSSYSFFANLCVEIWEFVVKNGVRTFNIETKKAQLNMLRIPCSVLLCDESQDFDGCQVDWIHGQKSFGTHVFFVGDSAQCIYQFRGAKSANLMKLDCIDYQLTKSWRFGPNIAKIANIPLFAKEKSLQTTHRSNLGDRRLWIPYRVEGAKKEDDDKEQSTAAGSGGNSGVITTKSLLEDWQKYKPLTLVGFSNSGLMVKAMDILGLDGLKNPISEDGESFGDGEETPSSNTTAEDDLTSALKANMGNLPKFHINGKGETSGASKWNKAVREIRHLYELFSNRDETGYISLTLPAKEFPGFANEDSVTWPSFLEICDVKEIKKYNVAVGIIATYQQNTLRAMDAFESHVTANKYSADEADIILTTVHSAKGLEWDHVEICEDLLDLSAESFIDSEEAIWRRPSFLKEIPDQIKSEKPASLEIPKGEKRKGWQFGLSHYRDADINLLYVAFTRAKKTLCVPKSIKMLLQDLDRFHYLVNTFKKDASGADGRKVPLSNDESTIVIGKQAKPLSKGGIWNVYHDLVLPLEKELEVPDDCMILPYLFPECEDESTESHKREGEERKSEVKLEGQNDGTMAGDNDVADYFDV